MPPAYLLAALLMMMALHSLLPVRQLLTWPWRWLGLLPMMVGLMWGGWSVRIFARRKTTLKPGAVSTSLVTDGPFRLSRNPIYLGMVLVLAGAAVLLGSLSPWAVILPFVWLIGRNIIPVEEAILSEAFGEPYRQYRQRVRRWI
jgi:protein-S-isoprenylcysteine O-methyltransferase Ste14